MPMPTYEIHSEMEAAWNHFLDALERSLEKIEADIVETSRMADQCTGEWCEATQHYLDDIANALFSISEPRWTENKGSDRIKILKRKVYDLYANYREVYRTAAG